MPALLLLSWHGLSVAGVIPAYKLPSPVGILAGFWELVTRGLPPGHLLPFHALMSLVRVGMGFLLAAAIAVPLGMVLGYSKVMRRLVTPLVEMIRPIPPLAWIPISILWFGIGLQSAAFIIFLGAFFPILLNTISGVKSVNPRIVEAVQTLGAGKWHLLGKVMLPGAMPNIFVGLRVGLGISWMTLVAAEFTGVRSGYGLGYMIMTARDIQRADEIFAGMTVIGLIGILLDYLIRHIENRLLAWT